MITERGKPNLEAGVHGIKEFIYKILRNISLAFTLHNLAFIYFVYFFKNIIALDIGLLYEKYNN